MSKTKADKTEQRVLTCLLRGDVDGAEALIEKMIEEDEGNPIALALMADVCQMRGEFLEALGLMAMAIDLSPDEKVYLQSFVSCAKRLSFSFSQFNELMFRTTQTCVMRNDIDAGPLWQLWLALLDAHPELSQLRGQTESFDDKAAVLATHPFFVGGLNNLIVVDAAFERLLISLRSALRRGLTDEKNLWSRRDFLRISAALSRYACMTEYIFDTTQEEERWIDETRQRFAENPAAARAEEIAVFACYEMLGGLPFAAALLPVCDAEDALKPVADLHIRDAQRLADIAKTITAITPIEEGVSAAVQAQYETFPYPRWAYLPFAVAPGKLERQLPQDAKALVAGCGTGYEAAQAGMMMPKADVLAVDLSRLSLSYAIARTQDAGIQNIRYAQADILRLAERPERYDYIRSAGVLHHMADPRAGWQVLRNILKPRGLMRIALYSEYGRQDVVAARQVIAEKGFAATRDGMKDFRRQMDALLPADVCQSLRGRGDFYQLSMLCDLLFHVQEHRFTLPQLAETLSALGLEFMGFDLAPDAFMAFHAMHGPSANDKDLQKWDALEQARPETFRAMYQFWCRAGK